jgi:hypothetical protein
VLEQRTKGRLGTVAALMAIDAVGSLRNSGLLTICHWVADLAFQTEFGVSLVAELDGLFAGLGRNGLAGLLLFRADFEDRCEKQDG